MWSEESAAEDSNASGAEHLLPRVLATPGLLRACTAYQDGVEFCRYVDGDVAAAQGHLSLLRLRRSLCEKNVAKGDNGDESISSRDGGSGSGVGGGGGGGCYSSYRSIASEVEGEEKGENREHQEAKPLPRIGNEAEEKGDEEHRAGAPLLEDLNFSHRAADWAAAQGHLEVVRWLLETREEGCTESAVDGACWNGHDDIARWLVCEWGQKGSERAIDYAASNGRLELVKWLSRQRGSICTVAAMDGAAGGGHLEVLRWLARNRREGCSQAAFEMAAGEGHLNVIKWLEDAGLLRCSSTGLDSAAEGGNLNVLQWMLEHKAEHKCSSNAYGLAASRGRLEVCTWLHHSLPDLRCPVWAAETAAAAGHLDVVRWLHASGLCQASLADLDDVVRQGRKGHLPAIIWLSGHGARASTAAVDRAAEAGHQGVVDFLLRNRQEGCSSDAMIGAARHGHFCIVKLLRELRPEQCGCCLAARSAAAAAGHTEIVAWLDENDPNILAALQQAVMSESCESSSGSSSSSSSLGDRSERSFFSTCNYNETRGGGADSRRETDDCNRRCPGGDEARGNEGYGERRLLGHGISAVSNDQTCCRDDGSSRDAHGCAAAIPAEEPSTPAAAFGAQSTFVRASRRDFSTEGQKRYPAATRSGVTSGSHFEVHGEKKREQQMQACKVDGGMYSGVGCREGGACQGAYGDEGRSDFGVRDGALSAPASPPSRQEMKTACRDGEHLTPIKTTEAWPAINSMAAQHLLVVLLGAAAAGVAAAYLFGAALCRE